MKRKSTVFYVIGLLLAVAILYGQFLHSPVLFDDLYFFTPASARYHPVDHFQYSPFELRSLPYATLAWAKARFGPDMQHFRIVSLLLHAAVAIALFFFLARLYDIADPKRPKTTLDLHAVAFFAALTFALHPVAVYAAAYLIQRSIVMATLFSLLTMLAWMQGCQTGNRRWLWLAVIFFYLAVFSKEHAIMLPAVLLALTVLMHEDWEQRLAGYWPQFLALLIIAGSAIILSKNILGTAYEIYAPAMLEQSGGAGSSHLMSALTQCWLFFKYAALWLLPNPRWMSADMREPFAHAVASGYLLALAAYVGLGVLSVWLLLKRGNRGLFGFALFFFWVMFLPELSAVRIQEEFVLYRSYLWAIGIFALFPLLLDRLDKRLGVVVMVCVAVGLVPASLDRLQSFALPIILWDDAVQKLDGHDDLPGAYRLYYNRGTSFLEIDEYELAVRDLKKAIQIEPTWPYAFHNLGSAYGKMQRWQESADAFTHAIDFQAREKLALSPNAYLYRGIAYEKLGKMELALADYSVSCKAGDRKACSIATAVEHKPAVARRLKLRP